MRTNGMIGMIGAAAGISALLTGCGGTTTTALPNEGVRTIASGTFQGETGTFAAGEVRLTESYGDIYVVFEDSFTLDANEKARIGFGTDGAFNRSDTFTRLGEFAGQQVYFVPESFNPYDFNEIVVYGSKSRNVIATAELQRAPETLTGIHAVEETETFTAGSSNETGFETTSEAESNTNEIEETQAAVEIDTDS